MSHSRRDWIEPILRTLGLMADGETALCHAMTGGVSSDILRVEVGDRTFCIKRALPRLKVEAHWEAPVERNAAEAAWIRAVAGWLPDAVPKLLAEDQAAGLFAMEYLQPDLYSVWKADLMEGRVDMSVATDVGDRLGVIHRRSARDPGLARRFDHPATFEAIRIDPYLRATARAHPALREAIEALAERTLGTRLALIHGDVSPKNILCGPAGPVLLDAECACYGDPAFDLAFCLNHLLLKAVFRPGRQIEYVEAFHRLARAYLSWVDWEEPAGLEHRCATLLPALLLARVDGKSPVEYLDEAARSAVRQAAIGLFEMPETSLTIVAETWSAAHG